MIHNANGHRKQGYHFHILIIIGMKISISRNYSIFTPIKGYFLGIISSIDVLVFLCS